MNNLVEISNLNKSFESQQMVIIGTEWNIYRSINFKNEDVFDFFRNNQNKFDLIMIKQTLHLFNKDQRSKLIKVCKNSTGTFKLDLI